MNLATLPWVGVKIKTGLGLSPMMHQTIRDEARVRAQTNVDILCANHDLTTENDFVPAGGRGR